MKNFLLTTLLFSQTLICLTQVDIDWQLTFGGTAHDVARHVIENPDGSFIMAGQINSTDFDGDSTATNLQDLFLVKTDEDGNILWKQFYDQGFSDEYFGSLATCADGGYVIGGSAIVVREVDGESLENFDCWIVKVDSQGVIEWEKTFGGSSSDFLKGILETSDGHFIAVGGTRSSDGDVSGEVDQGAGWIIKLDNNGIMLWEKSYGSGIHNIFTGIASANENEFYIVGKHEIDVPENNYYRCSLLKINGEGEILWDKTYKEIPASVFPEIVIDAEKNILLATDFKTQIFDPFIPQRTNDFWAVKVDENGQTLWENEYGTIRHEILNSISATDDGGYILGGSSGDLIGPGIDNFPNVNIFLVKLDANGEEEWTLNFGGSNKDNLMDVNQCADGSYILAAHSNSNDGDKLVSYGGADAWFLKIKPLASSLHTQLHTTVKLYPNPTSQELLIDQNQDQIFPNFLIVSPEGKLIKKGQLHETTTSIYIGDLNKGLYYLQLESENQKKIHSFVKL